MELPRPAEPASGDEREMLRQWLAFYRGMVAWKCSGLSPRQLAEMAVPPSRLSLLGLVRHLSEMERAYLRNGIGGAGLPFLYCSDEDPDGDFERAGEVDPAAAFRTWQEECAQADKAIDEAPSLDLPAGAGERPVRRQLMKVITEYARHTGHADLLRERIDGATGD